MAFNETKAKSRRIFSKLPSIVTRYLFEFFEISLSRGLRLDSPMSNICVDVPSPTDLSIRWDNQLHVWIFGSVLR